MAEAAATRTAPGTEARNAAWNAVVETLERKGYLNGANAAQRAEILARARAQFDQRLASRRAAAIARRPAAPLSSAVQHAQAASTSAPQAGPGMDLMLRMAAQITGVSADALANVASSANPITALVSVLGSMAVQPAATSGPNELPGRDPRAAAGFAPPSLTLTQRAVYAAPALRGILPHDIHVGWKLVGIGSALGVLLALLRRFVLLRMARRR